MIFCLINNKHILLYDVTAFRVKVINFDKTENTVGHSLRTRTLRFTRGSEFLDFTIKGENYKRVCEFQI